MECWHVVLLVKCFKEAWLLCCGNNFGLKQHYAAVKVNLLKHKVDFNLKFKCICVCVP